MVIGQRVLLVDGLSETEQVLKAVLEPRGLRVDRVRGHVEPKSGDAAPSVVVLHEVDADLPSGERWGAVPRVIIGSAQGAADRSSEQCLPHPFQYRELIQAIDRLLNPEESRASA